METRVVPNLQIVRPQGAKNDKNTQELADFTAKKGQTPDIPTGFPPGTIPSVKTVPLEPHSPGTSTKNRDNSSKPVEMSQNALAGCQNVNTSAAESVKQIRTATACESSDINYPESDKSGVQRSFIETASGATGPQDSKMTNTRDIVQNIQYTAGKAQIIQIGPGNLLYTTKTDSDFKMDPQYEAPNIHYLVVGTIVGV